MTEYFWALMKELSMTRMARSTSSDLTFSLSCIRALASAILIMDSM